MRLSAGLVPRTDPSRPTAELYRDSNRPYAWQVNRGQHQKTLLRILIDASGLSRRKAFSAIREGRVAVDGAIRTDPSAPLAGGRLTLDGGGLTAPDGPKMYLLMNKPAGVISTTSDPGGRPTVLSLVPVEWRLPGLHPVGRLDQDTTGLLLLTSDGNLTFRLTHPSHEVEKEYWLSSRPRLSDAALDRLRAGVELDGAVRRPAGLWRLDSSTGFEAAVVLREGRKRQVRRMLEVLGMRVTRLKRVREGSLVLGELPEGEVRRLTRSEVRGLLA